MVYYFTSKNIKLIRNIMTEYESSNDMSPYEYMKSYIEKCSKEIKDSKVSWIIETFLGIQKHHKFLKELSTRVPENLSDDNSCYFITALYGVIFQITPLDSNGFYKCLFNLSKSLLNSFTKFFGNPEIIPAISQIAQVEYDKSFVKNNIIHPLSVWLPYFSEMNNNYKDYLNKIESRNCKLPTIPIDQNVLIRKGKKIHSHIRHDVLPSTPPNSLQIKKKNMLTKSKIDQSLKVKHETNQEKAQNLLNIVKNINYHYAKEKSEKVYNDPDLINDEYVKKKTNPKSPKLSHPTHPVKHTAATIKRINKTAKQTEQDEIKWLQDLVDNCNNTSKIDELLSFDRQEKERERLTNIERNHLMGLISYEEAVIAKKNLYAENRRKYEGFIKEKQVWEKQIQEWKMNQIEKNRKQVEKLSLIELDMLHAKNNLTMRRKETADKLRLQSEENNEIALKNKQTELERRINMIKEIKVLAMIAKQAKLPKIIDLTESSGFGLLSEMSIAELQERLAAMRVNLKEELETKRNNIKQLNEEKKCELEQTKKYVNTYLAERAEARKKKTKFELTRDKSPNVKIKTLKKLLEEKRTLRLMLTK